MTQVPRVNVNLQKAFRWVGLVVVLASCAFFLYFLAKNWAQIPPSFLTGAMMAVLIAGALLYQVTFVLAAVGATALLGQGPSYRIVLQTLLISQFAKYLPGNVAHHLGRVAMLQQNGTTAKQAGFALMVEMVSALVISVCIVAAYILVSGEVLSVVAVPISTGGRVAILAAFVLLVVLGCLAIKGRWTKGAVIILPSLRSLCLMLGMHICNFLIWGAIAWAVLMVMVPDDTHSFGFLTAVFALAWVLGFVTPGAPGGVGVRETAIIALIAPVHGPQVALFLSIGLRIVTTIGDFIGLIAGVTIRHLTKDADQ